MILIYKQTVKILRDLMNKEKQRVNRKINIYEINIVKKRCENVFSCKNKNGTK